MLSERGVGVGIYLGQMPLAEMARLKAEIAETLIANFSYPRFLDYHANTLRMRPVDRAKRQEVWTFLSSFDFNSFSRIDVMSPDFQRQVERLLIQFVQRNRAFFGQQGRKRMGDVRALISSSSIAVTDGLRGHLNGSTTSHAFGNPRPVTSWASANDTGKGELNWEQIVGATMLLQQQLQEVRGESRPSMSAGVSGDARPAAPTAMNGAAINGATTAAPRRSPRLRSVTQSSGIHENGAALVRTVPPARPIPQDEIRANNPPSGPLSHQASAASVASDAPVPPMPSAAPVAEPLKPTAPVEQRKPHSMMAADAPATSTTLDEQASTARQPRELTRTEPLSPALANKADRAAVLVSDEDVVIFEQLRHQLIVWLRVEVVRMGVEISGQNPNQLIEILGQQDGIDETGLQVVSTLLGLANQVIANGHATLLEYKQTMMFYLMHTRRAR
ncbi:MAG TPA: hypothetical protein VKR83_04055 [Ktedonobacteraceae bacterium]|nr:hypothetical protein [Ktedonobacteraceae bacterium]